MNDFVEDVLNTILEKHVPSEGFLELNSLFASRYKILEQKKSATLGTVYKCFDQNNKTPLALKIINPSFILDNKQFLCFWNDIASWAKLNSQHIIRVYEADEYNGMKYFTMEWLDGKTLRELINNRKREQKPFSFIEICEILLQIIDALTHIHDHMVHRNLKPENVMILKGTPRIIKITDIGISRLIDYHHLDIKSKRDIYYLAPEYLQGKAIDKRADIYALGKIFFELLNYEKTDNLLLPSQINKNIPHTIDDMYKRMVTSNLDERLEDLGELSIALRTFQKKHEFIKNVLKELRKIYFNKISGNFKDYLSGNSKILVDFEAKLLDDNCNGSGAIVNVDLSEDLFISLNEKDRKTIQRIEGALRKIEDGTYGICENCGEEIDERRLQLIPIASCCLECQEQKEHIAEQTKIKSYSDEDTFATSTDFAESIASQEANYSHNHPLSDSAKSVPTDLLTKFWEIADEVITNAISSNKLSSNHVTTLIKRKRSHNKRDGYLALRLCFGNNIESSALMKVLANIGVYHADWDIRVPKVTPRDSDIKAFDGDYKTYGAIIGTEIASIMTEFITPHLPEKYRTV